MNFPFNLIIIPALIITLAYLSRQAIKQGLHPWYDDLRKPKWTPPAKLIGEIWIFLYVITALAVLWYWNVPVAGWFKYIVGAVLLSNAYFHKTWNEVFFVQHDLAKASQVIKYLLISGLIAVVLMVIDSPIAAFLMLPYILWVVLARQRTKQLLRLTSQKPKHK